MYAILAGSFGDNSSSAFGIFKFYQSMATAIGFAYASYLELHWQLLIVGIFNFLGTFACIKLEIDFRS